MRTSTRSSAAAVVAAAFTTIGCHRAPQPAPAPTSARSAATSDDTAVERARRDSVARADAAARAAAARADSIRRANESRASMLAAARADLTSPIHFDFDRADLLDAERPLLNRKAALMKVNPSLQLRIEGSTDERGSDEYNLALGMRRASAVKRYLTELGVDASRLTIASNGEERPVCRDHDEICWMQNRRAEFAIAAGGDIVAAGRD